MRRNALGLALLLVGCSPAVGTSTYLGFRLDLDNAPPPPAVVFQGTPAVVVIPGTSVYEVQDADVDMFRFGVFWYVASGGYWYRAPSYGGPFVAVDVRAVPREVVQAPGWREHHRHDDRGDRDRRPWHS